MSGGERAGNSKLVGFGVWVGPKRMATVDWATRRGRVQRAKQQHTATELSFESGAVVSAVANPKIAFPSVSCC